tara:strand:- start:6638 stop:7660 length:1023 start_codon:yes stop_codon:yes gene_type:complete
LKTNKVIVIAEAGVNHNGDIEIAKKLIDIAEQAGADYVKFQTFKADTLASKNSKKAEYQKKMTNTDESQYDMLKKLELSKADHETLINYCSNKKINFLSSPFDIDSVNYLDSINIPLFKIPSGEITNLPYLMQIGSKNKPIILSTGMSNLIEIKKALDVLIDSGSKKSQITVLHCNTEYPTPFKDVNMNAMLSIKNKLNIDVGYSDHTIGIEISLLAVSLGAKVIEKHFTLDKNMDGPDHAASLNPLELKSMILSIRNIEKAFGTGIKQASSSELPNIVIARKSIFYNSELSIGSKISDSDIISLRPGDGISPMLWNEIIGKTLKVNVKKFQKVSKDDFK